MTSPSPILKLVAADKSSDVGLQWSQRIHGKRI